MSKKMALSLTHKEREVFDFIKGFVETKHYPPSFKQVANHLNRSVGTAQWFINALELKGRLKKTPNEARTIQLIGE